ncbi:hypothetical protein NSMM_480003 [Nitrosomonas mobilis]|uniref:Uncharacterized protein n=1 Tax=Nitrosomonas mobilis TaxID=51642 RepID=A0A1G5SHG9_9PROT|nr:hypothetical protein NSMM_480003 [Nitrosomonas mobilis]
MMTYPCDFEHDYSSSRHKNQIQVRHAWAQATLRADQLRVDTEDKMVIV